MKGVLLTAGILLGVIGAVLLIMRLAEAPLGVFDSVAGAGDFLKSDAAIYVGGGSLAAGLLLIVVGIAQGGPAAKKNRLPNARMTSVPPPKPAPVPAGESAPAIADRPIQQPEPAAKVASDAFSHPADWELYTGSFEFEGDRIVSSEMFGVRSARRTGLASGDSFRVRARVTVTKDAPTPTDNTVYVGVAVFDAAGNHLGHYYTVGGSVQTAAQGAVTYDGTLAGEALLAADGLGQAVAISPAILLNYGAQGGSSGAVSACDLCELEPATGAVGPVGAPS